MRKCKKKGKHRLLGIGNPTPKTPKVQEMLDSVVRLSNTVALRDNRIVYRSCYMEVNKRLKK